MNIKANLHCGGKTVIAQGETIAFSINGRIVQIHGAAISCDDNSISLEIEIQDAPFMEDNEEKGNDETLRPSTTKH